MIAGSFFFFLGQFPRKWFRVACARGLRGNRCHETGVRETSIGAGWVGGGEGACGGGWGEQCFVKQRRSGTPAPRLFERAAPFSLHYEAS